MVLLLLQLEVYNYLGYLLQWCEENIIAAIGAISEGDRSGPVEQQ